VQDSLGNTILDASDTVTLAFGDNATGARLLGTTAVAAVNGVATFGDLVVDQPGSGYTLVASTSGLAGAKSTAFIAYFPFSAAAVNTGMHTCAVTTGREAYCWGYNVYGEVGDGTVRGRRIAVPVAGGLSFTALTTGAEHTCGLTPGGAAYCWGYNRTGQVGDGTLTVRDSPVAVAGGLTFVALSAGAFHTCGVTTGRAVFCWGWNGDGQLGNPAALDPRAPELTYSSTPIAVIGGLAFTAVSAGGSHTCGLAADSTIYCWGSNKFGQLGDGTTTDRAFPEPVVGAVGAGSYHLAAVTAGGYHSCGLTTSGTPYCWGRNDGGELGDGTSTQQLTPVAVAGGLSFAMLSAGGQSTCGVATDRAAYCWGDNSYGQLGDGTTTGRTSPGPVSGALSFTTLDVTEPNSCGVTPDGRVYCWGDNFAGQLGNGAQGASLTPVQVVQ
jgi:alpha-tubulin suppressor-like RCC1 family protein